MKRFRQLAECFIPLQFSALVIPYQYYDIYN